MPKIMPLGLQIYMFKKLFLKANADRGDPHAEMDNIDWETLSETANLHENLQSLKTNYPEYNWEIPVKELYPELTESIILSPEGDLEIESMETRVEPHNSKVKGKTYVYGRIQLSIDKKWIGQTAWVVVGMPVKHSEFQRQMLETDRKNESEPK